jgi:hypothetical protein
MSKEDPFPWDDPLLIYIGIVMLVGSIILWHKEIFELIGL